MLIAVGERANDEARGLSRIWDLTWAAQTPAFVGQMEKLEDLLGVSLDRAINLLPPHPCPAPWDARKARKIALAMVRWARGHDLVLLGRKVASAFGLGDAEFGEHRARVILMPHPSGRNRLWNDEEFRAKMRRAMARFSA